MLKFILKISAEAQKYIIKQEILMGKVISISNQKGGVGKTTTSVNLSACLAEIGKKVLLIDLDPQGNASSGVGIDRGTIKYCVDAVISEESEPESAIVPTKFENLFVMPSTINLAGAELNLMSSVSRETRLKDAVEKIRGDYDYIIVDCPPSLGLLTLNALTASDSVLIPLQCEYYALEGIVQLINTIRLVQKHLNKSLKIEGVLLTMFDARTNLGLQVIDEARKFFEDKLYKSIVPRNVRLGEAPSFGEPIITYDPKSRGAEAYRGLAKEVVANE